ncbi:MAG: hypothetical protein RLZZ69_90 [Cyanobacteriota bacterium]|jgi:hypothetical protein
MKPLIAIFAEYQSTSETHLATDLAIATDLFNTEAYL